MLKKIALTFFSFFFIFPSLVFATESATFHSDITIKPDTSLTITETIVYTTDKPHHGIYRYLPRTTTEIPHLISVTDDQNHPYPYTTKTENNNLIIRIGDPNQTFTGTKTYHLTYTYRYPLKKINNHYELYWDITGEGWKFPLKNVQATIHSPTKILQTACYSGEYGSNDKLCQTKLIDDHTLKLSYPQSIDWNKNLTVALKIDPQGIKGPGLLWQFTHRYLPTLLLLFPTLLLGFIWFKIGRDDLPDGSGKRRPFQHLTIPITAYQPPKNLTPAQVGILVDNKLDNRDLVAEIIDLARKKYLKIEKIETKKLFGHKTDYFFNKLKEADDSLPSYQKLIHQQIFKDSYQVKLSELKGNFYKTLAKVKKQVYQSLKDYFHTSIKNKTPYFILSQLFITTPQFFYFIFAYSSNYLPHTPWIVPLFLLLLALDFAFSLHLYSYNSKGMKAHLYAKGFYQNLKRGAWRDKIKEKHLFIEEVIPYAVAFGTIKQLAKDMKDLNLQPPEYLDTFTAASLSSFTQDLNNFAQATASNIAYNPNSGSSGSSGFSGGFSGGGGGGGGGGSW